MLKFVARVFEGFLEVMLWLNLIILAIVGGVMGWGLDEDGGHAFLGVILGIIVGFIYNIIFGGLIVIFVNMGKEIRELRNYVMNGSSSPAGNEASVNSGASSFVSNVAPVKSGSRICPNCKKLTEASSNICSHCYCTIN